LAGKWYTCAPRERPARPTTFVTVTNAPMIHPNMFLQVYRRPDYDRGNAYPQPNFLDRRTVLGNYESFDCAQAVGARNRFGDVKQNDAVANPLPGKGFSRRPPCFVQGKSLYDGQLFNLARRGRAPVKAPPRGRDGALPLGGRP
jgi:hypothetical protein